MNNENQEKAAKYLLESKDAMGGLEMVFKLYEYCVNHNKLNCFNAAANYFDSLFDYTEDDVKLLNELIEEIVKAIEEELIERKDD